MWYKNNFRRHLCDMHIDDWDESFLSEFSPEEYVANLKKAKIKNAMLYFQSHVGLCYYPTKSGKIHNGFIGKEDAMRRLADLCHKEGISVTGYYSLIYNTWAHDKYPEWRLVDESGKSSREAKGTVADMEFADNSKAARYGLCCPNNPEYREFVATQIKEMSEYFTVDGMFYDMLFWPRMCYCDACKKRWTEEVGGAIPKEYIPAVDAGVQGAMQSGILAGYNVVDVKVTLYDGSYHEVDSSEMAFKIAASMAFKEGMKKADPVIKEPIMLVNVIMPDEYLGDVMGDLNSRRGMIQKMEALSGAQRITAMVPLSEMFGYATELRSRTQGRGQYTMEPSHYSEVPKSIQDKIVNDRTKNN